MNDNINISVKDSQYKNNNDYSIEFNPDNITKIKKDYEDFNNKYKVVSEISKKYDDRISLLFCISILFAAISCIAFIIIDTISDGKLSKIIPIEYFVIGIFLMGITIISIGIYLSIKETNLYSNFFKNNTVFRNIKNIDTGIFLTDFINNASVNKEVRIKRKAEKNKGYKSHYTFKFYIDDKKLFKFKYLCNDVTFTDTNVIKFKDEIKQNDDIDEIAYFISIELPNSLKNI
jgi:hypothetical protein